jgi:ribosome biogenesis GTPase
MIENVFQRSSEILDPPVANVDHLLVLFSLEQPRLDSFVLTRFLIEAESTGIPITLALNKVELVDQEVGYW